MNDIAWMDRYWKEVLEVSTRKHDIKGSVSLQYGFHLKWSTIAYFTLPHTVGAPIANAPNHSWTKRSEVWISNGQA